MPRLDLAIVRLAAPVVPDDIRRDWKREWEAELAFDHGRGRGGTARAARAVGAVVHACWLRWDRWRWDVIWNDLKYAARSLRKHPGFTVVAVLSLAVGIGANAAIFGAVRAVLLRPLPFSSPEELVAVSTTTMERPDAAGGASSPPDFTDWRRDLRGFVEMAAVIAGASALTGDGPAEQVPSASVTGGFFGVLGVPALYGRALEPADDPVGAPDVAVLGHALWQRRYGGRRDIVGSTITLDSRPFQVVGVMPAGFAYPLGADLWIPQRFSDEELRTQRGAQYLDVIARLAPGVTLLQARDEMRAFARRLAEVHPRTNNDRTIALHPMREALVGDVRAAMFLMLGAVGLVLLIVCVNVANLVLTRAVGRRREWAVRTALGAGRARLVRGLLAESGLLAVVGGLAGLVVAMWVTRLIAALEGSVAIPLLDQTRVDGTVALFTLAVSGLAAAAFGTLPAWQASKGLDVAVGIREEGGGTTGAGSRQRLRGALIVVEAALAVVLLVGAGLLMRSFLGLVAVDLGFSRERVQTFNLSLPELTYPTPPARAAVVDTLLSRVRAHPEVEAAAAIFGLPLTNFGYVISMSTLDERTLDDKESMERSLQVRVVTPDYFRAMGIPIRRGRAFGDADRLGAPPAVLVNETAAARLWPGQDPLGHSFAMGTRLGHRETRAGGTVVGVVGDVRDFGPARAVRPTVYLAHAQRPVDFVTIVVKARSDPGPLVPTLNGIVATLDPNLPLYRVRTMDQLARDAVAQPRLFLMLLAVFAIAAVLLAAVGIYGVMAHAVSQRTREIGLRIALGAERGTVLRMVVGQAMTMAVGGLAMGMAGAMATGRLMRGLLFGVEPFDPVTFLAAGAGFAGVALVASALPARRAARVDPVEALRES
ncbi:MAG: ABC transporter permease [Acidobacteria bacterium]|nr:ABC transporter permease [Acidobacteriota bacterium]